MAKHGLKQNKCLWHFFVCAYNIFSLAYNNYMTKLSKIMLSFVAIVLVLGAIGVCIFFYTFKTDYKQIVAECSAKYNIKAELIFSIIKAESKFNKNATSRANAIGLMQVKLDTANYMLSLSGEEQISEQQLYDPKINIDIGTQYFAYLVGKFESVDTSICAYNAGETIVREWLSNSQYSDDGKTLSKIPYAETQNYLNKVKFNLKVYSTIV